MSFYNSWCRRVKRRHDFYKVLFELVLEHVHAGNLGALPPSPEVLTWKAVQIGLTTTRELADVDVG